PYTTLFRSVILLHPLLVLLRRRLLHGVEQLLAELGGRARRLRVRDLDVVVAHAVRLGPFLVIAGAGRLAPGHGDAGLAAAAPAGLLRQLLHRILELGELLDRLLLSRLPASRLAAVEVLLGAAHPILGLLQHLLVLGTEDGE